MKKPSIAFIGDLTVDRYVETGDVRLGGAALNMAIWAKRSGAFCSVVTAVGNDDAGRKQLAFLKQQHIDTSCVQILKGTTSEIEIFVSSTGERRYGQWNAGTLSHYHLRKSDIAFLKKQDAVCVTIYPQFEHILQQLRSNIIINFGDFREFNKSIDVVLEYISRADILVFGLNKDEDEALINTLRDLAKEKNKIIIITLGLYGSIVYAGKEFYVQPAKSVKAVDTTGAGDSFLAGFLVQYFKTKDIQKSLTAGTLLASEVIQKVGAY